MPSLNDFNFEDEIEELERQAIESATKEIKTIQASNKMKDTGMGKSSVFHKGDNLIQDRGRWQLQGDRDEITSAPRKSRAMPQWGQVSTPHRAPKYPGYPKAKEKPKYPGFDRPKSSPKIPDIFSSAFQDRRR